MKSLLGSEVCQHKLQSLFRMQKKPVSVDVHHLVDSVCAYNFQCRYETFGALKSVCKAKYQKMCTTFGAFDSLISPVIAAETAPIDVMTLLLCNTLSTGLLTVLIKCLTHALFQLSQK